MIRPRLVALAAALVFLASCGTFRTARVVSLGDIEPAESVWRPDGEPSEPEFVDENNWLKRNVVTSMNFEPSLETFLRAAIEEEIGRPLDEFRIDYVGYRYAYYFPSRHDDFVLRVELESEAAGLSGEYETHIAGNRLQHAYELFDDWENQVPHTGPEIDPEDRSVATTLEAWADRRAYLHRMLILHATDRLTQKIYARAKT